MTVPAWRWVVARGGMMYQGQGASSWQRRGSVTRRDVGVRVRAEQQAPQGKQVAPRAVNLLWEGEKGDLRTSPLPPELLF